MTDYTEKTLFGAIVEILGIPGLKTMGSSTKHTLEAIRPHQRFHLSSESLGEAIQMHQTAQPEGRRKTL